MKHYYLLLFAAALLASCTKIDETIYPDGEEPAVTRYAALQGDPYRLSLMQEVLDERVAQTPGMERIVLRPTDLYVRFLPKDSLQVMTLMQADIPHLFQPLNEAITYTPDSEYDIPEGFRWIYSVVPADYEFPEGIHHEVIYEVFIQRPAGKTRSGAGASTPQLPDELYKSILSETLSETGYAPMTRNGEAPKEWRPSARFRFVAQQRNPNPVWTDTLPIPRLPIHILQGTNLQYLLTDENGETGLFDPVRGEVNYHISWDNDRFILWDGEIFGVDRRPVTRFNDGYDGMLDVTFTSNEPLDLYRAGAFRAMSAYFQENRPGMESIVKRKNFLHVALNDGVSLNGLAGYFDATHQHPLKLWTKSPHNGRYYTAVEAMSTAFHELGHASHYYRAPDNMVTRSLRNRESWANGVAYGYMKSFFPDYGWDGAEGNDYTRVVECMLNNGYSFQQIQHGFYGSTSWDTWRKKMLEFGILDSNLLNLIFSAPNTWTFDMSDVLQASVSGTVYTNYPVSIGFKPEARRVLSADRWEVVEGSGAETVSSDEKRFTVYFTEPGKKRIRATVTLHAGITKTYEQEIYVRNGTLISAPSETIQGYEFTVNLLPMPDYPDARVTEWSIETGSGSITQKKGTSAVFEFSQPGKCAIKARILFSPNLPAIDYRIPVSVKEQDVSNIFGLVNKPQTFQYNTQYEAEYKGTGNIEVTAVGLNHNSYLPSYDFKTWSYDRTTSRLRFSIPSKPVVFDYTLLIFYKINGIPAEAPAELVVSNYRDHI